jgi:hypothetical protein
MPSCSDGTLAGNRQCATRPACRDPSGLREISTGSNLDESTSTRRGRFRGRGLGGPGDGRAVRARAAVEGCRARPARRRSGRWCPADRARVTRESLPLKARPAAEEPDGRRGGPWVGAQFPEAPCLGVLTTMPPMTKKQRNRLVDPQRGRSPTRGSARRQYTERSSRRRKTEVALRIPRGDTPNVLSRELGVGKARRVT